MAPGTPSVGCPTLPSRGQSASWAALPARALSFLFHAPTPLRQVCTLDGHVYERAAIEGWLAHKDTSPLTGEVLENKALIPQHLLRSLIREWRQGQGYLHVKP